MEKTSTDKKTVFGFFWTLVVQSIFKGPGWVQGQTGGGQEEPQFNDWGSPFVF